MKAWFILLLAVVLSSCGGSKGSSTTSSSSSTSNTTNTGSSDTTTSTPPAAFKLTCDEAQFIKLLNIYRLSLGASALVVSKSAVIAGRWHAQDMIDKSYFDHFEPNGRSPSQRGAAFGASISGENIAAGNASANNTFCQWKLSPGHNANMINAGYKSTGIGRATGGTYRYYWSSNFSGSSVSDALAEPLTLDAGCVMPTALPTCS